MAGKALNDFLGLSRHFDFTMLFNEEEIAGNNHGRHFKEKKKEWIEDYFLQLAAYSLAHNEMFGTDINRGVVMIATREAKYQEFVIEGDEFNHYQTKWAEKLCAYYDKFGYE